MYVSQLRKLVGQGAAADEGARLPAAGRTRGARRRALRAPDATRQGQGCAGAVARPASLRRSPTADSRSRRSRAWRSCGCRRSRIGSRPISPSAATRQLVGELEALVSEHRCGSACVASSCSPSTGPAARQRRSRHIKVRAGSLTDELGIELGRELRELEPADPAQDPSLDRRAAGRRGGRRGRAPSSVARTSSATRGRTRRSSGGAGTCSAHRGRAGDRKTVSPRS